MDGSDDESLEQHIQSPDKAYAAQRMEASQAQGD
jgi:hypothetical protein